MCVRVRDLAPNLWYIRSTARLVPIEWPDSTVIRLAILPAECAARMSARFEIHNYILFYISFHYKFRDSSSRPCNHAKRLCPDPDPLHVTQLTNQLAYVP